MLNWAGDCSEQFLRPSEPTWPHAVISRATTHFCFAVFALLGGAYVLIGGCIDARSGPQVIHSMIQGLLLFLASFWGLKTIPETEEGVRRKPYTLLFTALWVLIVGISFFHPSEPLR